MIDYTPFLIGALFGFGAGFMLAHYIHRLPQLRRARKAAKSRQINTIKRHVHQRVRTLALGHTVGSAIVYYKKFHPEMFEGCNMADLERIARELGEEESEKESTQS